MRSPLQAVALRAALAATAGVAVAAGLAGAVRLLPWLLDPGVTLRQAVPFARGLALLALEAAILVGWPIGWSLAAARMVERGEARAVAALGESPARTVARLTPQAVGFAGALGLVSLLGGREASEPGRVVGELLERGRESCAEASLATTYVIPFADVTWLCTPGMAPRLAGRGPGALSGAVFTAASATASGDLHEITLTDARVVLSSASVHAGSFRLRGLSPFARASSFSPAARALGLALAGVAAAAASAREALAARTRGTTGAIAVGGAGALAALGAVRWLDRWPLASRWAGGLGVAMLVPAIAVVAVFVTASLLSRLPRGMGAASKGVDHG